MNSISSKAGMESVYLTAKKVYENLLTAKQGVARLRATLDSSEASIKMYFNIYACMRKGKVYKMGTSEGFTRYLLESILKDEGKDAFMLALSAAKSNSIYRESVNNAQPGIKKACLDAIASSGLAIDYEDIAIDVSLSQQPASKNTKSGNDLTNNAEMSKADREKLISCIELPNSEFASTLMSIAEKYQIFDTSDVALLCDRQQSRELFYSDYAYLKEIDTSSDISSQLKSADGRNRYYGTTYIFNSTTYVFTSQLYGLAANPNRKNNRNPFWEWVLQKFNIDPSTSDWWPSLAEYTPGFTKDQWLEILSDPEIVGPVWGAVLAMFHTEPNGATCKMIAEKFNDSPYSISGKCTQLAKKIHLKTNCPLFNNPHKDQEAQSYWPILFLGRDAKGDMAGTWVWKLRSELFEALTEFGIEKYLPKTTEGGEKEMTIKEKIAAIKTYIAARGFNYEGDLIENFYLSLKSKPFVILAGTSGTGKTRLVKLFAEAIGAKMQLVPVRPDWSDSSDLFGHNDLSGQFHPGAIIDFVKQAEWDKDTPYFLCLDEMNLARVEYYLSDFLSIIETRDRKDNGAIETDALVDASYFQSQSAREKYGRVYLPENLYIIGTVNMDETTFPFSKKVLDRANTIEFSFVNLMARAAAGGQTVVQKLDNSFLKTDYLYLQDCDDEDLIDTICFNLEELNQILVKANLHVGYRVRDEISFYMMNNKKAKLLDEDAAFDHEIMQKILPRVQGSSAAIKDVLSELFVKCAGDYTGFAGAAAYEQMSAYLDSKSCKYPNSAKKIAFMMRRYEEDGFTSYWL